MAVRGIYSQRDLDSFVASETFKELLTFAKNIGEACVGHTCGDAENIFRLQLEKYPAVAHLDDFLNTLLEVLSDTPIEVGNNNRFGNVAFRTWHQAYLKMLATMIANVIPQDTENVNDIIEEITGIGVHAFGHSERLDYGTGHEASFLIVLFCFDKLGLFELNREENLRYLGLVIFKKYVHTVRNLQAKYRLEPAGSHGVWSLDDHQCLVFYFGSCQLNSPKFHFTPKILRGNGLDPSFAEDFLLCAQMIHTMNSKTGTIEQHTPILAELSAAKKWVDLQDGFLNLFEGEVLGKLPVVQHFLFGSVFRATWEPEKPNGMVDVPRKPAFLLARAPTRDLVSRYFDIKKKHALKGNDLLGKLKSNLLGAESSSSSVDVIKNIKTNGWNISAQNNSKSIYEAERTRIEDLYSTNEGEFQLPEQCFTGNFIKLEKGSFLLEINTEKGVLGCLNVLPNSIEHEIFEGHEREKFLVFQSKFWQKRNDAGEKINAAIKINFDWTFTTSYLYSLYGERGIERLESSSIDYDLLRKREEFLFYSKVTFYEDDLDDFGLARLGAKIRVMNSCFFVLSRFFLRVDRKYVRIYDTRVFHKFGSDRICVEVQRRQLDTEGEEYRSIEMKAKPHCVDEIMDKLPIFFSAYFDILL